MSKRKVIKAGTTRIVIEKHVPPKVDDVNVEPGSLSTLDTGSLSLNSLGSSDSGSVNFSESGPSGAGEMDAAGNAAETINAAKQQADQMRQEAQNLLAKAQSEVEQIYQEAQEKGYNEGMAHAEEQAKEELIPIIRNLKEQKDRLSELKNIILKQNETEIIDLALDIARKVIGAELHQNPATVGTVIKAALDRIDLSEKVTVKIHPSEYEVLMKQVPEYLKDTWIVADSKVSRGGAVVDTESGSYDARIETQLEEIEKNLKKDIVKEGL